MKGQSYTAENKYGARRTTSLGILAPKHFRKLGRRYISDVKEHEIASIYFGVNKAEWDKNEAAYAEGDTQAERLHNDVRRFMFGADEA